MCSTRFYNCRRLYYFLRSERKGDTDYQSTYYCRIYPFRWRNCLIGNSLCFCSRRWRKSKKSKNCFAVFCSWFCSHASFISHREYDCEFDLWDSIVEFSRQKFLFVFFPKAPTIPLDISQYRKYDTNHFPQIFSDF